MLKDGSYLVVNKSDYTDNLGLLTASLKSSKKSYITFSDPKIVHRAVLKTVLIPEIELESLDKAVKPAYWNVLQILKSDKGFEKVTFGKPDIVSKYGNIHSFGLSDEDDLSGVMKWHNLNDNDIKVASMPNKYCIITKKF